MSPALQLNILKHKQVEDPVAAIKPVLEALKKANGLQAVHFGSALDADNTAVLAIVWRDIASAFEFVQSELFVAYFHELEAITVERPNVTHCLLRNPKKQLEELFTAAAIEMAPLKLKGDKVSQHYHNFQTAGKMIANAKGYVAQFQAPQIQDPFVQWSLVGWDSIELHHAFNDDPDFPAFLELVAPNVDMPGPPPIIHVHLKLVSGSL